MPEHNNNVIPLAPRRPNRIDPPSCMECGATTVWTRWDRNELRCNACGWTGLLATCTNIER